MKTKHLILLIIALLGPAVLFDRIFAQEIPSAPNIAYPVQELNNCKDEADCRAYCDLPKNIEACVAFGEKNNLLTPAEVQTAKKFIAAGGKGPGGCSEKKSCEAYCDSIDHIDECVKFSEENNLMSPAELAEAKQVQAAIKRGVKPPACSNKSSCDVYCEAPENMEECVAFGIEAGFIQGQELEEAQKMLAAVKRGVKPPPCRGKDACEVYCSTPENMEMCMNFAIEAGFMSGEEAAEAQKMLVAVKNGIKPPQCRGREECDAYCSSEEHFEECTNFAEAAGFMSAEEAAMARKTKGKTPGGCRGKEECEAFCNNPDNQETCFNFAKENGMISEEEIKNMNEGKQRFQESFGQMPPGVLECVNSLLGSDVVEKIKSGEMMPSKEIGDKMSECFSQMGPPPDAQGLPPGGQFSGPGGCSSPEECRSYCESHPQECQQFAPSQFPPNEQLPPPNGQLPPPGGQFPPQGQFQPPPNSIPYDDQRIMEGFQPPPGMGCSDPEGCTQIIQEQMTQQYNQQLPPPDGQYQNPPEGQFQPPSNMQYPPPPAPSENLSPPQEQTYQAPPPSFETSPPPPDQNFQAPPPPSEPTTNMPDASY